MINKRRRDSEILKLFANGFPNGLVELPLLVLAGGDDLVERLSFRTGLVAGGVQRALFILRQGLTLMQLPC